MAMRGRNARRPRANSKGDTQTPTGREARPTSVDGRAPAQIRPTPSPSRPRSWPNPRQIRGRLGRTCGAPPVRGFGHGPFRPINPGTGCRGPTCYASGSLLGRTWTRPSLVGTARSSPRSGRAGPNSMRLVLRIWTKACPVDMARRTHPAMGAVRSFSSSGNPPTSESHEHAGCLWNSTSSRFAEQTCGRLRFRSSRIDATRWAVGGVPF